jgi:Flp pilus assembly protein TadG
MFALFLTVLLGALGLSVDLGIAFSQKRTMQNAADAGAMAGARIMAKWTAASPTSAQAEVSNIVAQNQMGNIVPTISECIYVNDAGTNVGGCAATVPANATGVRVTVQETHPTYFIKVLPGAPNTVTTSASASANVQLYNDGGPFIVCGTDTYLAGTGKKNGKDAKTMSILLPDTTNLDPKAIGKSFEIHNQFVAGCGYDQSSDFDGLEENKKGTNDGRGINQWWNGDHGTVAGPTRFTVRGAEGCQNGNMNDCILILPIAASDPPARKGKYPEFYVVRMAAFRVIEVDANTHWGVLLEDSYIASGPGTAGWCRGCGGVAVVKMTK